MKTLRELLVKKDRDMLMEEYPEPCAAWKCFADEEGLEEILREHFKGISYSDKSDHRWRVESYVVTCIPDEDKDRYFRYTSCRPDGDLSWEDSGYYFEGIDNVVEVEPYEVTSTAYRVLKKV